MTNASTPTRHRRLLLWLGVALAAGCVFLFSGVASATLPVGTVPDYTARGTLPPSSATAPGLRLSTDRPLDVVDAGAVIVPGGDLGWHSHSGIVILTIQTGEAVYTRGSDCQSVTLKAGESVVEPAEETHILLNKGPVPVQLHATELIPVGSDQPLGLRDEPKPGNCGVGLSPR